MRCIINNIDVDCVFSYPASWDSNVWRNLSWILADWEICIIFWLIHATYCSKKKFLMQKICKYRRKLNKSGVSYSSRIFLMTGKYNNIWRNKAYACVLFKNLLFKRYMLQNDKFSLGGGLLLSFAWTSDQTL